MAYVYRIGREAALESIQRHAHYLQGACLDVGAQGKSSRYKGVLTGITSYTSLDINAETHPDIVADAQNMPEVADSSYDSIICTQVLYGVPQPHQTIREFSRILRPGGTALITVPFINPLIGGDYWRFTPSSMRFLLEGSGFEVLVIEKTGVGVCSVLHQLVAKGIKNKLHLDKKNLSRRVWNKVFILTAGLAKWFDRLSGSNSKNSKYFLDVTAVAKKR